MLYNLVNELSWNLLGPNTTGRDIAMWTGLSLDTLLWVGLFLLVVKGLWPTRRRR